MRIRELLLGEAEFESGTGDAGPPITSASPKGFLVGPKGMVRSYGVPTYSETDPHGQDFAAPQADQAMQIVPPKPGMDMGIHSGAPPSREVWPPPDQLI